MLRQPLGIPMGEAKKKQMPIPLAIPLVMAAASAASSIYGGIKSRNAARDAQAKLDAQRAETEAERRRRMNEDYLDTAAGQNLLRIARNERDRMWQRERGAAAVGGGTDAAVAMAKEQGNRMIGDAIANIAANDSQRKDNIDASYRAELSRLNQQDIEAERAKGAAIAQAASGASSALMQGAISTFGGTRLGHQWFGTGSPGGGGVTSDQLNNMEWQERSGNRIFDFNQDYDLLQRSMHGYTGNYWG